MFRNLDENRRLRNSTCPELIPNTGPNDYKGWGSPSRCAFYKSRVIAIQGRAQSYASKEGLLRDKYIARDNACEAENYDSAIPNTAVCNQARKALEDYLEIVRKQGEIKVNEDAMLSARNSAGLRPNDPVPEWFKTPVPVGFDMLFTPEARAQAITRIGAKNEKLRQQVAIEQVRLQNAVASKDIGPGVGHVCPPGWHDDGCCCRLPLGWNNECVWWGAWWTGCATGGDVVGKLNREEHGGNRLACPSDHPDRVDGLCYRSCPASHPHHITGMPYLCAKSSNTNDVISDQFNYDNYDKADAEHAISCAEAVVNRNQAGIDEHCGFDARAKAKAMWEDVGGKLLSAATLGAWDATNAIVNAIDPDAHWNQNTQLYGHPNRGGAVYDNEGNYVGGQKGAADLHIDGVIDAYLRTKDIATEEACVKAIDDKNLTAYLKYCPLFEEVKPTVLDAEGKPQIRAILPPEVPRLQQDASGVFIDPHWDVVRAELPPWDVPEWPTFNEDLLPPIPPELLEDYPDWLLPKEDKPDMIPPAWPGEIAYQPLHIESAKEVFRPTNFNIMDHPQTLALAGAFLVALLAI